MLKINGTMGSKVNGELKEYYAVLASLQMRNIDLDATFVQEAKEDQPPRPVK